MDVEWVQCVNTLICTLLNLRLELKEDGLGATQGTLELGDAQLRLRERFVMGSRSPSMMGKTIHMLKVVLTKLHPGTAQCSFRAWFVHWMPLLQNDGSQG
jgi:hypothetical protein